MPKDAKAKALTELNKLKMMSPMSAEATVVRNYIDWLVNVPWRKRTKICYQDLAAAEHIPEADHYGLEKVKERILEYLAVQQRARASSRDRSCAWSGRKPGVGKTSLGRSIARATNRKFVRMSLRGARRGWRFAAIAAPTSAQCPARSCRIWPRLYATSVPV